MATSKAIILFLAFWSALAMAQSCFSDPKLAYAYLMQQKQTSKINLNTAHESELITLSGIGIKTAQAIVAYRREQGRFASVDELVQVRGIGEKTLAKNRARLFVDEPPQRVH